MCYKGLNEYSHEVRMVNVGVSKAGNTLEQEII